MVAVLKTTYCFLSVNFPGRYLQHHAVSLRCIYCAFLSTLLQIVHNFRIVCTVYHCLVYLLFVMLAVNKSLEIELAVCTYLYRSKILKHFKLRIRYSHAFFKETVSRDLVLRDGYTRFGSKRQSPLTLH